MVATMAHSPAVLGGFLDLNRHAKRAKLDRRIGELISIAVQARLGCSRCLQAHSDAARTLGLTDDDVEMARDGSAFDPAWAAMVELAMADDGYTSMAGVGRLPAEISCTWTSSVGWM